MQWLKLDVFEWWQWFNCLKFKLYSIFLRAKKATKSIDNSNSKNEWYVPAFSITFRSIFIDKTHFPFDEWSTDWIWAHTKKSAEPKLMTEWFDFKRTTPTDFFMVAKSWRKIQITNRMIVFFALLLAFIFFFRIDEKSHNLWRAAPKYEHWMCNRIHVCICLFLS